jgi:hypothetical protein
MVTILKWDGRYGQEMIENRKNVLAWRPSPTQATEYVTPEAAWKALTERAPQLHLHVAMIDPANPPKRWTGKKSNSVAFS